MATEIELKLYCLPSDIDRIEAHLRIREGEGQGAPKRLENVYFDTPDLSLYAQKMALRVRNTPTRQLQTVKCAAESVAGLSSRPEWETPFGGRFDFAAVDNPAVRTFLEARQEELVPIFATNFERKTWKVVLSQRTSLWVMIDVGEVSSGEQVLPISEVELELIHGNPSDLLDFAITLTNDLPLVPNDVSKAERGYQLFLNRSPSAARAQPSAIDAGNTPVEAFLLLAQRGMLMWQTNQLGVLTVNNQEFVHQFRVALRRLGSLLKVFKSVLPPGFSKRWGGRLKQLSQAAADMRDLEVMREDVLLPMLQSEVSEVRASAEAAIAACDLARLDARVPLRRLRYGGLVMEFARDLRGLSVSGISCNPPGFAEHRLSALHRKACTRLKMAIKATTPESAHHLRIALKNLRYSCEFFAPLFDQSEMQRYARAIAELQDELGFVNDVHVARARLQRWIAALVIPSETGERIAEWYLPRIDESLRRALPKTEALLGRSLPWCGERA